MKDNAQTLLEFPPTIWELKPTSCRYVLNEGNPASYIFCGKPKAASSYCAEHYRLCYVPGSAPVFRKTRKGGPNER